MKGRFGLRGIATFTMELVMIVLGPSAHVIWCLGLDEEHIVDAGGDYRFKQYCTRAHGQDAATMIACLFVLVAAMHFANFCNPLSPTLSTGSGDPNTLIALLTGVVLREFSQSQRGAEVLMLGNIAQTITHHKKKKRIHLQHPAKDV